MIKLVSPNFRKITVKTICTKVKYDIIYLQSSSFLLSAPCPVQDTLLLKLVELLVGVATDDSTPPANRHSAFHATRLLARKMASSYHQEFIKVSVV